GRLGAADYRARATQICNDSRRETQALGRPRTTSQFKAFLARGIQVTEHSLRRLEALRPPKDLQAAHAAILTGERRGLAQLRALETRLHGDARDVAVLKRTQPQLDRLAAEAEARYRAAGLAACTTPADA
ncbi:MAG TPA: hypothetical protein VGJ70_16210, partial [Solirubrobacteraceae bacterium]